MLAFNHESYSLQTNFRWRGHTDSETKDKEENHDDDIGTLIEERNLPGTLLSMQIWHLKGSGG